MLIKRSPEDKIPGRKIQVLFAPGQSSRQIETQAGTAFCCRPTFCIARFPDEIRRTPRRCVPTFVKTDRKMRIETFAVHAGHAIDAATGAVATPIHLSTTFERDAEGGYPHGYSYGRSANPTRHALEEGLAALEGGEDAAAFGSGLAACSAILQALAPGDHVVAPTDVYHGMTKLLREVFARWGLEVSFVDMTKLDEMKQAVRPRTKLIWVETPSNPRLRITDIARVVEVAHAAGAICVCDNTWAPIVQRPLDLGADLVIHSTTKYLGGHSDVMGGIAIAKKKTDFFERVREIQATGGAVPSPFDCWLILRGMRSLPL